MKLLRNFFSTLISIRDRYVKLSKVDNEIVFFFLPEFKNIIELLVQIMISSILILCFTYIYLNFVVSFLVTSLKRFHDERNSRTR